MSRYGIVRTSISERRQWLAERKARLEQMLATGVEADYLKRSRETAADIIGAHAAGGSFIDVGNVPNIGQISNLPTGVVVETAVHVDANGFAPIAFGPLPEPIVRFIEPCAHSFSMLVDACFEKDRERAIGALRVDPVCSHLTGDRVREMALRLLEAHRRFELPFGPKA